MTELVLIGFRHGTKLTENIFLAIYSFIGLLAHPVAKILLDLGIIPNQVTALRLLFFTPINLGLVLSEYPHKYVCILINSLIGFFSDAVDGQMTRISGVKTDLGKLLDPLADKALVLSFALIIINNEPAIFGVVAFFQVTSALAASYFHFIGGVAAEKLQANKIGKAKMFFYSTGFLFYGLNLLLPIAPILAKIIIVIGIPLDFLSQYKKIKQLF